MGFPENEPSISQILVKRRTRVCNQFARKAKLKIPILQKKKMTPVYFDEHVLPIVLNLKN